MNSNIVCTVPGGRADFGQPLIQALCAGIAPAAFGHERIPNLNVLLARSMVVLEHPFEQLLVALSPFSVSASSAAPLLLAGPLHL